MNYLIQHIRLYLKLSIIISFLFVVFYGGANWINGLREGYFHLYFEWELGIPFIPWMIVVYLSIQLLFLTPVFHCDRAGLMVLAKRMATAIFIAGVVFIVLPTTSGFVYPSKPNYLQELFSALYSIDKPHNLFPSLHITLSSLVVVAVTYEGGIYRKTFYFAWLSLLYVSVLLIHQHHIVDIFGGLVLVFICIRIIPHQQKSLTT